MPNTELVLWDWNGTLLDDLTFTRDCLNRLLAEYGYPQRFDDKAYRDVFGFPIEDYYRRVGFDFSRHPYPLLAARFMELYLSRVSCCGLVPGAAETLQLFRKRGLRQVVLSASRRDYLIEQVTARGLAGCFEELLGLQDIYAQSKVETGRGWMQKSGVLPQNAVMVGDTLHDAEVAQAMGVRCVLCTTGHQSRERLLKAGVPLADSFAQLAALL